MDAVLIRINQCHTIMAQGTIPKPVDPNFVPQVGTWSGNQTLASLQSAIVRTGISHVYMADSQISGWALVIAFVSGNSKTVQILGGSCAVRMHTDDGTNWGTSKWGG